MAIFAVFADSANIIANKVNFLLQTYEVKLVAKEFHRFYLLPILRTFSSIIANSRAPKMLVDLKMQYLSLNFSRYKLNFNI